VTYQIEFTPCAERQIRKLPRMAQERIASVINSLQRNPRPTGVKKLEAEQDTYRFRTGDYRIIYQIQDRKLLILILTVGDRKDIYRNL
jgi:mRNA interferase RelE/StbE